MASTLTMALASRLPMHEAMQLANLAASIVVQKTGTATVSVAELNDALKADTNALQARLKAVPVPARSWLAVSNQMQLM